jgi:hypothetical protein
MGDSMESFDSEQTEKVGTAETCSKYIERKSNPLSLNNNNNNNNKSVQPGMCH